MVLAGMARGGEVSESPAPWKLEAALTGHRKMAERFYPHSLYLTPPSIVAQDAPRYGGGRGGGKILSVASNPMFLGELACFWTVLLDSIYRELLSNWPASLCHSPAFIQRWTEPMGRARSILGRPIIGYPLKLVTFKHPLST